MKGRNQDEPQQLVGAQLRLVVAVLAAVVVAAAAAAAVVVVAVVAAVAVAVRGPFETFGPQVPPQ